MTQQDPIPGTELHLAARDGDLAVIIRASRRDLNKPDGSGLTPVHWAAWKSNSETVKLLLSKGYTIHISRISLVRSMLMNTTFEPRQVYNNFSFKVQIMRVLRCMY